MKRHPAPPRSLMTRDRVTLVPVPCQNTVLGAVSWSFGVGSGDPSVFVDHATEDLVATDGAVDRDDEGRIVIARETARP